LVFRKENPFSWTPDYDQTGTYQVKLKVEMAKVALIRSISHHGAKCQSRSLGDASLSRQLDTNITLNAPRRIDSGCCRDPDSDNFITYGPILWVQTRRGEHE
jgi:hypothetical protein